MKKTYQISHDKFMKGKKLITENSGTIYSDGTFEIKGVKGNFHYDNGILDIVVTDKPWIISWSFIGDKLDNFFN